MGIRKVKAGQRVQLGESFINGAIDLINASKEVRPNTITGNNDSGIILVKNTSAAFAESGWIMGMGGSVIVPSTTDTGFRFNTPAVEVDEPDIALHFGHFVILLQPLNDGQIGRARLSGIVTVKVDMINVDDLYADVIDAESAESTTDYLQSHSAGTARIMDVEDGIGVKWALVALRHTEDRVFKAVGSETDNLIAGKAVDGLGDVQASESDYTVLP